MHKYCSTFFLIIFSISLSYSQSFIYKNYSIENGLPSNEVYQILRDSKEYLWFATDNGTARFDGAKFTYFNTSNGLPNNTVLLLYEDTDGKIWFIDIKGQLSYFLNDSIIEFKFNYKLAELNPRAVPVSFTVINNLIYISYNFGTYLTINNKGEVNKLNTSEKGQCHLITGNKYVFAGIAQEKKRDTLEIFNDEINRHAKELIPFDASQSFYSANKLSNGQFAFVSGCFIYFTDFLKKHSLFKFNFKTLRLYEDNNHNIWLATINNGIKLLNFKTNSIQDIPFLKDQTITCFTEDYEGGFWISTHENGVFYIKNKNVHHLDFKVAKNNITCLEKAGNDIICGTSKGEVLVLGADTLNKIIENHTEFITDLLYDSIKNKVYVASNGFFNKKNLYDATTKRNYFYLPFLSNIAQHGNTLYGGNIEQFYAWNMSTDTLKELVQNETRITSCVIFQEKILAGNYYGLFELNRNQLYPFLQENTLLKKRITCLENFKDSALIIGTRDHGLLIYSNNHLLEINELNGLNTSQVRRIRIINDNILVCTNKGFARIKLNILNNKFVLTTFSSNDGLSSDDCWDILEKNDKIYVANNKGIDVIQSKHHYISILSPPIYITSVAAAGNNITFKNSKVNLKYSDRNIIINFDAITFRNAENISFRYRFNDIDTSWYITTSRTITLPLLPPGNYQLIIEPLNKIKNSKIRNAALLNLFISAPFYRTYWFYLICFVALLTLSYAIIKISVARKINLKLVEIRQRELLQEERSRIATDIHDDIGSDLTKISLLLNLPVNATTAVAVRRINLIAENVQSLLDKMDDVIWLMNPTNDTLNNLLAFIRQHALEFFDNTQIEHVIEISLVQKDFILPSLVRRNLFLTVKEILNNIAKHSKANFVSIKSTIENDILEISIEDCGIGFDLNEKMNTGNGLRNINERIQKCGGTISIFKNKYDGMTHLIKKKFS